VVVDEHNAETGDITTVEPGSTIAFEMLDAASAALGKCGKQGPMLFGSACAYPKIATLGSGGIKIAAVKCGGKARAIVLFDSNGITPDFRNELLGLLAKKGVEAEIFTTDTHQTNSVRGVLNPVGKGDRKEVAESVLSCLERALGRMGRVSVGTATRRFRINVLGPKQSAEIISTVNSIVAVAKIAVPIILIGTVMAILWGVSNF
jgi:putative membrane protein